MDTPQLLYFCDFPPSNWRGGTVLMSRLLADYPPSRLTVLTGRHYTKLSPLEGRLACRHIIFPNTNETGRWGIGRLKTLCNILLFPVLVIAGLWVCCWKTRSRAILSVADGRFFIAAACVSWATGRPLILMLHDDWVESRQARNRWAYFLYRAVFRLAVRQAGHIYAVSPAMQEMLRHEYGVTSELQLPAREAIAKIPQSRRQDSMRPFRIVYAGTGTSAMEDGLGMLVALVKTDRLAQYGLKEWELRLYTPVTPEHARRVGWLDEHIKLPGWVSQTELLAALHEADLLFLPFSFREDQKFLVKKSFPTKTADYLAIGKPILVLAPEYSSVVPYLRTVGGAEIVTRLSSEELARAIVKLAQDQPYCQQLVQNARSAFAQNHNITQQRNEFYKAVSRLTGVSDKGVVSDVIAGV